MGEAVNGSVRYYALTDERGQVSHLGRVVKCAGGLHGEMLHEGAWVECRVVLECLFHDDLGAQVDLEEAKRLAAEFGGSLG
jgi:hypothetical protein